MRQLSLPFLLLLAFLPAPRPAVAGPPESPAPPVVIFPTPVPAPQPAPPPAPGPTPLAADQLYLVRASVACTVVGSPDGLLKVTAVSGPLTIRAKFVDGKGYETRTLTEKYLWLVEAVGSGQAELIVVAQTAGNPTTYRQLINAGGVGPGPSPPAPTDALTKALQAAYALDNDADRAKSLDFLKAIYLGMAASVPDTIATAKALHDWEVSKVQAPGVGLGATQVVNLRRAIAAEMAATFGTQATAALTPAAAAAELGKIASALKAVR